MVGGGKEGIHLCRKAACRGVKILAVKEGFPPGWGLCIRCQRLSRGRGGREGGWRVEDLLVGAAEKDEPGTSFCAIK